mgnify:CR=1 FL=1
MYQYTEFDKQFVQARAAQYRDQLTRNLAGELGDDEFRPLRLQNGWYVQRYAPMLRVAVPYGELNSAQLQVLAKIARDYDTPSAELIAHAQSEQDKIGGISAPPLTTNYGHFTTRHNVQFNWIPLEKSADVMDLLASVNLHGIQTSGNCIRNTTVDHFAGVAPDEIVDPLVWCEIIRQWSAFHPEFAYLPRKFKIAISGAETDRAAIQVHDVGLQALHERFAARGFAVLGFPCNDFLGQEPGTAEEILYLLGILLDPANRDQPVPMVLTGPRSAAPYFEQLHRFIGIALGAEAQSRYEIIIDDPAAVARRMVTGLDAVRRFRRAAGDADRYVRDNPWQSIAVAAGVAFTGAVAELHLAAARHQGLVLAATIARDDEAERRARHEEAVASHHGSLSRETRLSAERRLKEGKLKAIVATASLELGIDIALDLKLFGSTHEFYFQPKPALATGVIEPVDGYDTEIYIWRGAHGIGVHRSNGARKPVQVPGIDLAGGQAARQRQRIGLVGPVGFETHRPGGDIHLEQNRPLADRRPEGTPGVRDLVEFLEEIERLRTIRVAQVGANNLALRVGEDLCRLAVAGHADVPAHGPARRSRDDVNLPHDFHS